MGDGTHIFSNAFRLGSTGGILLQALNISNSDFSLVDRRILAVTCPASGSLEARQSPAAEPERFPLTVGARMLTAEEPHCSPKLS